MLHQKHFLQSIVHGLVYTGYLSRFKLVQVNDQDKLFTCKGETATAFPWLSMETNVKKASTAFPLDMDDEDPWLKIFSSSTITSISIERALLKVSKPRTVTSEPGMTTQSL
jgi:hypothetical protein